MLVDAVIANTTDELESIVAGCIGRRYFDGIGPAILDVLLIELLAAKITRDAHDLRPRDRYFGQYRFFQVSEHLLGLSR